MHTIDVDKVAELDRRMIEVAKQILPDWQNSDPELHVEHNRLWIERTDIVGSVFGRVPDHIRDMIQAHTMLGEAIEKVHYPSLDRDGELWRSWCTCGWESDELADGNEVIALTRGHVDGWETD